VNGKVRQSYGWLGSGDADRWHIDFCDLTGGNRLLGQIEGRTAASVSAWIEAQSDTWRTGVRVVAIDMCTVFKAAVRDSLPHVTLVVDRFHVAQLANTALTEVRRRVTVQVRGRRGRKGNREWELRNRLTRSATKMHADHLDPMAEDLQSLPKKIGQPILAAWNVKEDLMDMLALHGTGADRTTISNLLTSSTRTLPRAACRRWNAWPRPCRPGGRRSSPRSRPASRTPLRKGSTG
jgi:transposase